MLISVKHKFVFLSNQKCASSSIIKSLKDHSDAVLGNHFRLRHTPYADYEQFVLPFLQHRVGPEVVDYPVYTLFREPTDWLFSWYKFRRRHKIEAEDHPRHHLYTGDISWAEFLQEVASPKPRPFAKVGRQAKFVLASDQKTVGPTLFRYENIDQLWSTLCAHVGKPLVLERRNVSPPSDQAPNAEDQKLCRAILADDYRIYDAILSASS